MSRKSAPWFRNFKGRKHGPHGRWYVLHNGKQTPLPVTDRNDEAAAWEAFRALLGKTIPKSAQVRSEPIAALIAEYLDSISHRVNDKTKRSYGYSLAHFAALFGSCTVDVLDQVSIEKRASEEKWSDSHRANYLWTVQAFTRWAGRKDFTLHRPAKESRGAETIIDEATQRLILRETRGDFHELCRFLWDTGARPMEAARITGESVNWLTGTVTLKRHKTKHKGKVRVLFLSSTALAILKSQMDRNGAGYLFLGMHGKPFSIQAVVTRFLRISEKIGRSVTGYCYRHSFCTRALEAGIPDTYVASLMGHCSTAMIHRNYSHINANSRLLKEAAELLSCSKGVPIMNSANPLTGNEPK